jgi:hypothetical protein
MGCFSRVIYTAIVGTGAYLGVQAYAAGDDPTAAQKAGGLAGVGIAINQTIDLESLSDMVPKLDPERLTPLASPGSAGHDAPPAPGQPAPPPAPKPPAPPPPPPPQRGCAGFPWVGPYGPDQIRNAAVILAVGDQFGVGTQGEVIAIATAMQESGLVNVDYGDRDSLGLFQQRPSQGWGTPAQVRDPVYAATRFYRALIAVPGWQSLPVTVAAQRVQRSGFPLAYAKHEALARAIVGAIHTVCH